MTITQDAGESLQQCRKLKSYAVKVGTAVTDTDDDIEARARPSLGADCSTRPAFVISKPV